MTDIAPIRRVSVNDKTTREPLSLFQATHQAATTSASVLHFGTCTLLSRRRVPRRADKRGESEKHARGGARRERAAACRERAVRMVPNKCVCAGERRNVRRTCFALGQHGSRCERSLAAASVLRLGTLSSVASAPCWARRPPRVAWCLCLLCGDRPESSSTRSTQTKWTRRRSACFTHNARASHHPLRRLPFSRHLSCRSHLVNGLGQLSGRTIENVNILSSVLVNSDGKVGIGDSYTSTVPQTQYVSAATRRRLPELARRTATLFRQPRCVCPCGHRQLLRVPSRPGATC